MTANDVAALEAQVNALDQRTVQRVVRLVFECNASLALALSAVQEADRGAMACQEKRTPRRGPGRILAFIGAR